MTSNWIQKAHLKQGALHKQLGLNKNEVIPKDLLERILRFKAGESIYINGEWYKVNKLMRTRAQLALNINK